MNKKEKYIKDVIKYLKEKEKGIGLRLSEYLLLKRAERIMKDEDDSNLDKLIFIPDEKHQHKCCDLNKEIDKLWKAIYELQQQVF